MKLKLLLIIVIFLGIITLAITINKTSTNEEETLSVTDTMKFKANGAYIYPVLPGTEEWNNLGSLQERVEACRVPDDILSAMNTPALVETVITYPFFSAVYSFDKIEWGIESLNENFGGLKELLGRDDAYECTLEIINSICPGYYEIDNSDWNEVEKALQNNKTEFGVMELINARWIITIMDYLNEPTEN